MKNTEKMVLFIESDEKSEEGMAFLLTNKRHQWATRDDQINLGEVEATYKIPADLDADSIRKKAIETLRAKQDRILADAYMAKQRLQDKIDKLILLTYKGDPDATTKTVVPIESDGIPF